MRSAVFVRALLVWIVIIGAETIHGIIRRIYIEPAIGDLRARQLGVLIGSLIILAIAIAAIRWIAARGTLTLLLIGAVWVVLTIAFEVILGRLVIGATWQKILADYNVAQGGLMAFGLVLMFLSPFIASKFRRP